jgi:hypothetical protein
MQYPVLAASILMALLPCAASGQERTDFSGIWRMDAERSESAHQAVPIGPVTMVIKQTAAEISIETRRENIKSSTSSETLTFHLDGSESTNVVKYNVPVKVKAHWDGAKLVTETERNIQNSTITTMYVLSLDAEGKEMTIDKTLTIQHGYQFEGAKTTGTGKDVFIRKRR